MTNKFTPSVVAPLEEWDNTTDVIVWLIEQKKELQINEYADLVLEHMPEHQRGRIWDFLDEQGADLDGYISGEGKVRFSFIAEYKDDLVDPESGDKVEGYEVTVTKHFITEYQKKSQKFAAYLIRGCDRGDFEVIGEKLEA